MALTLFSSNRIELLQEKLSQDLASNPPADPLAAETVVVPTFAVGRWLNLRFARERGIAANIEYPQPATWVWRTATRLLDNLPERDPSAAEALVWQCFDLLPALLSQPEFGALRSYLSGDDDGTRRWQLAQRIAQGLDRYQTYRPAMIRDWDRGLERNWQAVFWRRLMATRPRPHRVETIARLITALDDPALRSRLSARVSLFALSSLPPLYFDLVARLARHIEVNLYLHSPTDQYWADLEGEKRRARRRLQHPQQDHLFETGNELLASWGRQGQAFQDLLLANDALEAIDVALYHAPDDSRLLGKLQDSIFRLQDKPDAAAADDSISIHICHSALRECEVLRDQLLAMLEQDPTLSAEDILVMIPDIGTYAPYIEAVFRGEALAFNLSDTTLADEHPQIAAFLQLTRLPQSRFALSEILSLLENESLRRRFGIEPGDRETIDRLVDQAHPRWGLDGAHKTELGLPPTDANTWRQAQDRFFAAFALAGDDLWHDIAPLRHWSEAEAEAIGRFWRLLDTLRRWRERLSRPAGAAEWRQRLLRLLDDCFVETDPRESRLQSIRDAIATLSDATSEALAPALVADLLASTLEAGEQRGRLYAGGVTFCGMRPMRSIPFRVICLLGMNRGDFPRRDPLDDFEGMGKTAAAGDPGRRIEDRYLMLETLLCARDRLYISYVGRSLKDNSAVQPSVLVRELLDFIDSLGDADTALSDSLIREHPMQAFAAQNYHAPLHSYSAYWCAVARELERPGDRMTAPWPDQPLDAGDSPDPIELDHLRRFLAHPVRYFIQQRLGIFLDQADETSDDEAFELDALERWRIKQQLGEDSLRQRDDSLQRLLAGGLVAHGPAALDQAQAFRNEHADWLQALADFGRHGRRTVAVDIELGADRVTGILTDYFPGRGLMAYHAGRLGARTLTGLWLDHLASCASAAGIDGESARLLLPQETRRFDHLPAPRARELLLDLCTLYREGSRRPLPVLPRCSYACASAENRDRGRSIAWREWSNRFGGGGDADDPYLGLILRNHEVPIDDPRFTELADRLYRVPLEASVVD